MALSHYQLLQNCSDEQLQRICERRRLPLPRWEEGPEGRVRLLRTMAFHLEDQRNLTDTLADLGTEELLALKGLVEQQRSPVDGVRTRLSDLGLILPRPGGWAVPERVADALADFDEGALNFQGAPEAVVDPAPPFAFSLALSSVLLRCVGGIRVLKGGLPAKKELGQLLHRNALLREEGDATLVFTLLDRLGLLWSREGRVDTLLPAVMAHPPRWIAERAFAKLLEDDLKSWNLPPADERRFLMQHLLERRGQVLAVQPFLGFLRTLHPLDLERAGGVFLPLLKRLGLVAMDGAGTHLSLSEHGEALTHEYLLRDVKGTEAHWIPLLQEQPMVLQPTLELLTPMVQSPHRLLKLAQLAHVDTLDAMTTFRVSPESLVRALDSGVPLEELRRRLGESDARLPQPLLPLLDDIAHRVGEVEVLQGVRLVKARDARLAGELLIRPELAELRLSSISPTILEVRGPGNAVTLLKQAGYLPKPARFLPVSLDGEEDLYLWARACMAFVDQKGMSHNLEPVRQMVRGVLQRLHDEDPGLFQEIQKRVPMLHLGGGGQAQEESARILDYAAEHTLMVELTYLPLAAHRTQLRRVTPIGVEGEHLQAYCHLHQEEMSFRLSRIQGVRLLSERGWAPGARDQAV
ncbi:MAG: helicase-associated domain-containing protein [Acidobacteria bacterium]|nr:helicase-associated domain-containing protein [Acidobacteriota bacterium]